ncbi:prepilin peptidase [Streptomyces sp. NPDC001407]|uniref:prepilin peptidase n=1 Tax=Streptomyces sp. NPDC001407 TaxID=3364573 RepID=UPI0036CE5B4E
MLGTVAVAFVAGALSGAAARPLVLTRAVPAGEPPREKCPSCATALLSLRRPGPLLLGRCPTCQHRLRPTPAVPELLAGTAFAAIAATGVTGFTAAAHYWLAACGVALVLIDIAVQRLPNILTLPACAGTILLLAGAWLTGENGSLPRALTAAAALGVAYLVLALAGMGMGDAKLAPAAGALLGWHSWPAVLTGTFTGFLLGAVAAITLAVTGKAHRKQQIAFGPFLLTGALSVSLWLA